jgi:serine/threonine-protein kinase RsbW
MTYSSDLILKSELAEISSLEEYLITICEECNVSDDIYPDIMLAVTEACTNGIIHGNQFDPLKVVAVHTELSSSNQLIFTVKDQGLGFNPDKLPNPIEEENLLKSGGRGVYLMKHYAGSVTYNSIGNEVILSFNLNV